MNRVGRRRQSKKPGNVTNGDNLRSLDIGWAGTEEVYWWPKGDYECMMGVPDVWQK